MCNYIKTITTQLISILLIFNQIAHSQDIEESNLRTWTSTKNTKIDGILVEIISNEASIKTKDGQIIKVNINMLSIEDQEFIKRFRKKSRLPLVFAYIDRVHGFGTNQLHDIAKVAEQNIETKVFPIYTTKWEENNVTLKYEHNVLNEFVAKNKEKSEIHIIICVSYSILAHPKLVKQYASEIEKYGIFAKKNNITLHVYDEGPLPDNDPMPNYDKVERWGKDANPVVEEYLKELKGWNIISLPKLRHACAERLPTPDSNFSWRRRLPDYISSAVLFSAISDEPPPLVQWKEEILRKQGFADPVVANPNNKGEINNNITLTSNENLKKLSELIHEVVNPQ